MMNVVSLRRLTWMSSAVLLLTAPAVIAQDVIKRIVDVPDYTWFAGCFGTGCGNLMGYWDRNGLPDLYTGPTAGGVAPLSSGGSNVGVRSMWASKAGLDGRPANQPGHIDDYWAYYNNDGSFSYESSASDPYVLAGRPEHQPDCIGDFIGLSQKRYVSQNGECDGNVDAYSFVYWDTKGNRRTNFVPPSEAGTPARDIQSGLRAWTQYRGYDAEVFTQLADFNPLTPAGKGFTFADLKREVDQGYPVLVFLQPFNQIYRSIPPITRANPEIHGMLVYGYGENAEFGLQDAYYKTSWGIGERVTEWSAVAWQAGLPVRGVIGFRPTPKVRSITRSGGNLNLQWDGPLSRVHNSATGATNVVHRYRIERSATLFPPSWVPVGTVTTSRSATLPSTPGTSFYRVKLLGPNE